MYLPAFVLAPHFYKELYKVLSPMSVQYVLISDWLFLESVMVTTLP